jgi:hypothetical protein
MLSLRGSRVTLSILTLLWAATTIAQEIPRFTPDPFWPKHLPNQWILGQVSGVAVDSHDHIWVMQRPRTTEEHDNSLRDATADCCRPAPAVLELDQEGNFVQGWGGPGDGYEWPNIEHGIFVDHDDNVWITGNGDGDTNLLKFSKSGKFLLQIGKHGESGGSNDTRNVNGAAGIAVHEPTNEVFVADGYRNRRVIVFDATTGAYGNKPDDAAPLTRIYEGPGPQQFAVLRGNDNDGSAAHDPESRRGPLRRGRAHGRHRSQRRRRPVARSGASRGAPRHLVLASTPAKAAITPRAGGSSEISGCG